MGARGLAFLSRTSSPAGASSGLSQDAKITIGVTIPVVFLAFALGVLRGSAVAEQSTENSGPTRPGHDAGAPGRTAPPMAAAQVAEPEPGWVHGGAKGASVAELNIAQRCAVSWGPSAAPRSIA